MYKVRLIENIFENHVAEFTLKDKMTVCQIRELLKLDNQAKFFQNGKELKDSQTPKEGSFTIKLVPGTFTTAVAIISVVIAISAVVIGLVALSNLNNTKFPTLSNSNASLRGSTNNARKSERLPLLLGKHRVYPDVAALPFSSYQDHNQYLHQLFCFGYSDVVIDYSTLKIGETLISYYEDCTYNVGLGNIYPSRVVENVYQLQLKNDGSSSPIVRSTASACKKIEVGLMAPNGIYKYEGEDKKSISVGIKVEWRVPDGSWNTAYEETLNLNTDKWRKMYSITPTGSTEGIYEVRISRTTKEAEELQVSDSLYLDVIKSFVGLDDDSSIPVTSDNLQLVSLKTKATDQLNGVIDSFNAICTLKTRSWDGLGTGSSHWTAQATRNPASAILYLLTNSNANAEPVEDSLIDWPSFEEFYQFCEDYGFNCDAWITTEYTVLQLCEFIAASNMAEMVIQCDKISIRAEKAQESVVQLFTPRNAWDFEMIRSFESKPKNITVNFDDETKGYVQVERKVALNDSGSIVFDTEVEGDSLTIDSFGVTSATQAARLGAQKLKLLYSQTRTYSWKSDIEGIFCLPGDVVLLENDNFLLGLGEGRIKKIIYNNSKITGIKLDARMKMVSGSSYGVRIRTSSAILDSLPVVTVAGEDCTLTFQSPQENSIGINVGDLVAFGEFKTESHKVLITDITPDQNRSCSFNGVDYLDDAYSQELTIPSYDSGLSVYPSDSGEIGASGQSSVPRYYVYGTKGEKGDRGDSIIVQYAYSTSSVECIDATLSWKDVDLYWGEEKGVWNWWTTQTLEEKDGLYIWLRTKVGDSDWVYTRLTGVQAKVCSLTCDKSAVIRNDRLTTKETYTFKVTVQGYLYTELRLTINNYDYELVDNECAFEMPYLNASAITANLYMDDVLMDTITLSVVDETQQAYYIGVSEADPVASAYGTLLIGDWYLDKTTNVVKIYNGETWDDLDNSAFDTSENLQKVSVCMADMIKIGTTNKTTATLLGVFKYLCADEAFVKSLFAEKISVLKEGYIQSENYDDGGDKRFKIQANGEAEFYGLKASEVEVSGDFSSSGFRTQKSSDEIPLSQSQQTANAWDSAIFFAKAIDIYNANYELKETINNGESSIYCAPITATWYGNTINYVGLFDQYSNKPIIGYTGSLPYQVYPFYYDGGDKNTISGAWLIKSSVRSEKVLAFFSSKWGYNILPTKEVHGSLMYVYTNAVGDSSASVRNSLTYECIGGWGFDLSSAYSTYDDWKPSTTFPYLSINLHTTCVSPSYVATVGDWSTANNLNLYYISNLSSLNIPTSWSAWIGTITIGNNSYISSASSLRYIYKENDAIIISKNNAFSYETHLSIFSLKAWSISISILSGIDGIAVKNIVPYTTGEGNVGTETLRFNEGYINNLTGNVNSEGDTEHKVYGAVFN